MFSIAVEPRGVKPVVLERPVVQRSRSLSPPPGNVIFLVTVHAFLQISAIVTRDSRNLKQGANNHITPGLYFAIFPPVFRLFYRCCNNFYHHKIKISFYPAVSKNDQVMRLYFDQCGEIWIPWRNYLALSCKKHS